MSATQSPARKLLTYALPSVVGMLIVGIQTFVDGIFVSKGVGSLGLAAVNLSMPIISAMLSIAIMIVSGGVVISGIAKGQGDERRVRGYTALTLYVLLGTILTLSLLVGIFLNPLCRLMGANNEVFPYVKQYLGIIGTGFIFYCIPNYTEAFTRLRGRPNWVLLSGFICCAVNIILDYFFVIRFEWGVAGAAIATCIANTSATLVLAPNVQIGRRCGSWREVGKIYYNGSSEMLTSISAAIAMYIFNLVLMHRIGPAGVAALTIVGYINMVVNFSVFGLSQAMYPLMSELLGSRDQRGIHSLLKYSMLFSAAIGIGTYVICLIFKQPIVNAFTEGDPELAAIASTAVTFVTLHYLVSFVNITGSTFHTAVERPIESASIALCRSIIFVLPPLLLVTPVIGDLGVWLSMPIAETLTLLVSIPLMSRTLHRLNHL